MGHITSSVGVLFTLEWVVVRGFWCLMGWWSVDAVFRLLGVFHDFLYGDLDGLMDSGRENKG